MEENRNKILIVEDEPTLVDTLDYSLRKQGYTVLTVTDGRAAIELARKERPDLVVLDIMLPGLDGFEVCRILRQEMSMPILMLTARTEEVDKIVGLEVGADDYLTKPFSMRELTARIKALLRRVRLDREESAAASALAPDVVTERMIFDDLVIDLGRREVDVGGAGFSPEAQRVRPAGLLCTQPRHRAHPRLDPGTGLGLGI